MQKLINRSLLENNPPPRPFLIQHKKQILTLSKPNRDSCLLKYLLLHLTISAPSCTKDKQLEGGGEVFEEDNEETPQADVPEERARMFT